MFFLDLSIIEVLNDALRVFLGFLCKTIYPMITNTWDLFMALAKAQIFNSSGSGIVNEIYKRVGLLLGLIMLFKVIFSLVQMLINPDTFSDKEKGVGNIAKKAIVVILLLGFTPTLFQCAFYIQDKILEDNVLARVILGTSDETNMSNFGGIFSSNLFASFYTLNSYDPEQAASQCAAYKLTIAELRDYNKLDLIDTCITTKIKYDYNFEDENLETVTKEATAYAIDFNLNGVFAVGVGAVVLWIMIMYCINLGARVVQLAFLQIVAPLAIVSYLSPKKDNGLEKWIKLCISTFLDVFIRISIIYFVSLVIYILFYGTNGEGMELLEQTSGATGMLLTLVKTAVILGLLMFAKKVPDLIGEIFPTLGVGKSALGFGISWKKMTEAMLGWKQITGAGKFAAGGVAGAAVGGAIGFLGRKGTGKIGGLLGGLGRGFATGSKKGGPIKNLGNVIGAQSSSNKAYADWRAAGGRNSVSRFAAGINKKLGRPTSYQQAQNEIEEIKSKNEKIKSRASSARSSYSAFDAVSSTGKDAKRAATTYESIGANGANYLKSKGLTTKLASAGINIDSNESFASILERSRATKERLDAKATNIDAEILKLKAKGTTTTGPNGQPVTILPVGIKEQIKNLEAEKAATLSASEAINMGEIEKAVGEARMAEFLVGNVSDGKANNEYDIAKSTVETVIENLRNTGDGVNDEDANVLQEYFDAVENIKKNGYDFSTENSSITVNGKEYKNAYDLYDAMAKYAQSVANKGDDIVRKNDEEIRNKQSTEKYFSDKADDQFSGGKK